MALGILDEHRRRAMCAAVADKPRIREHARHGVPNFAYLSALSRQSRNASRFKQLSGAVVF